MQKMLQIIGVKLPFRWEYDDDRKNMALEIKKKYDLNLKTAKIYITVNDHENAYIGIEIPKTCIFGVLLGAMSIVSRELDVDENSISLFTLESN